MQQNQQGGYNVGFSMPPQPEQPNAPPALPPYQPGYNLDQPYQPGYNLPPQQNYQPFPQGGYVPPGYQPQGYPSPAPAQYGYTPPQPQMPIMNQPQGYGPAPGVDMSGWMSVPQGIPNCPPGLEYLTTVDQLLVKQKVELLEAFTGFETNNKFTIKNGLGQKVFWAVEENDCCTRNCCGPSRPFDMKILDAHKNQVIHLYRPLRCDSCLFPCCLQEMEVTAPPGNIIGSIKQNWSILSPSFDIKNASGETVLQIDGPICTFSMCGEVEFKLRTLDGKTVGRISKQWSGLARELFTDADFFGIQFPIDLDVRMKAVMLGACFLIDAMFFEKSGNVESDRPGMF